jgi:hypothetical protein
MSGQISSNNYVTDYATLVNRQISSQARSWRPTFFEGGFGFRVARQFSDAILQLMHLFFGVL